MSIDLTSLIAKKNYLGPIGATELPKMLLEQLKLDNDAWAIDVQRPKSCTFALNWKELYVEMKMRGIRKLETSPASRDQLLGEFDANPRSCLREVEEARVDNTPSNVGYIVTEERVDGCILEATCKPVLYIKIVRGLKYDEQIDLQDVRIQGGEFLDQIFVGGLGSKEIHEVKEISQCEFLFNDACVRKITERVYEMLSKATTCVLFFGWFGTECIPKLKELKEAGVMIRAITHNPSERKAAVPMEIQKGYSELISLLGLDNVSTNPLVHGRAIIVDNKALIGSMDLNAFSLSGEHIEFAIYTEDPSAVRSLRAYFDKIFKPLKKPSEQGA